MSINLKPILTEKDVDPELIKGSRVSVIGYGNQGHAHALNLRDQGVFVTIGARPGGQAWPRAVADGFAPVTIEQAVRAADVVVLTLPDESMAEIYRWNVAPSLRRGQLLLFAHGFNIAFQHITPPDEIDVGLVGPKGAGKWLRSEFEAGRALAALIAVHQDATGQAMDRVMSYAWGIGCAKGGLIETTIREEAVTDLFGEQAVLCGGLPELIKAAYEILVEAGYSPEAAYLEVCHEVKLIADLVYESGLSGMRERISDTAEWGGYLAGPRIINAESKAAMREILAEIESGEFAKNWIQEASGGGSRLATFRNEGKRQPMESLGAALRGQLPSVAPKP